MDGEEAVVDEGVGGGGGGAAEETVAGFIGSPESERLVSGVGDEGSLLSSGGPGGGDSAAGGAADIGSAGGGSAAGGAADIGSAGGGSAAGGSAGGGSAVVSGSASASGPKWSPHVAPWMEVVAAKELKQQLSYSEKMHTLEAQYKDWVGAFLEQIEYVPEEKRLCRENAAFKNFGCGVLVPVCDTVPDEGGRESEPPSWHCTMLIWEVCPCSRIYKNKFLRFVLPRAKVCQGHVFQTGHDIVDGDAAAGSGRDLLLLPVGKCVWSGFFFVYILVAASIAFFVLRAMVRGARSAFRTVHVKRTIRAGAAATRNAAAGAEAAAPESPEGGQHAKKE